MTHLRLRELFLAYYNKTATAAERKELLELLHGANSQEIQSLITECGQEMDSVEHVFSADKAENILNKILNSAPEEKVIHMKGNVPIRPESSLLLRWLVAASVLILAGIGGYYLFLNKQNNSPVIAEIPSITHDIPAPERNRAVITLASGRQVFLDSANDGTLATEGSMQVKMENGQIVYSGTSSGELHYNTITNPRGSKVISLLLADGSSVWLNAETTLKYPAFFSGKDRQVEVTGEAYFDIATDEQKKFIVVYPSPSGKKNSVEVIGTEFNIQAYKDEEYSTVTLINGKVDLVSEDRTQTLQPGEQAVFNHLGSKIQDDVSIEEVIAWKNGFFMFNSVDIETILRQTARWYDIETAFKGKIPTDRFSGRISRDVNLSDFLKVLEYSEVHFNLEGRKITVMP